MRIETKSAVILLLTLLLGVLIGVLAAGAVAQKRMSRIAELRERGIAMHVEGIVEPIDDAQREAIRAVLEEIGQRNRVVMTEAHQQIRGNFEELREQLDPLLDDEQRQRLEAAAERFRGGRGFGPPGRRGHRRGGPGDSVWKRPDSTWRPPDSAGAAENP
jgi:uncharacterized membrane protein